MPVFPVYNSWFLKADRRPVVEVAGSRAHQTVFGQARFDDVFLRPGAAWQPAAAGLAGPLLVLPVVGGALLATAHETDRPLLPGCLYTIPAELSSACTLTNPFEKETVNLLVMQARVPAAASAAVQEIELPLATKNELVAPTGSALPVRVGLYDSRAKDYIRVGSPTGCALCYVLNGSFEIEDRLVEHRDALVLWNAPTIGFEALAETALLFYLQFEEGSATPG